jgi:hypothetical protein
MPKHSNDRLQGTLDLLILKILDRSGPLRPIRSGSRKGPSIRRSSA